MSANTSIRDPHDGRKPMVAIHRRALTIRDRFADEGPLRNSIAEVLREMLEGKAMLLQRSVSDADPTASRHCIRSSVAGATVRLVSGSLRPLRVCQS